MLAVGGHSDNVGVCVGVNVSSSNDGQMQLGTATSVHDMTHPR